MGTASRRPEQWAVKPVKRAAKPVKNQNIEHPKADKKSFGVFSDIGYSGPLIRCGYIRHELPDPASFSGRKE